MKLLYAHDHKFYKYKDDYYSNGSFPREVLLRYTNVFEEVRFISRQILVKSQPEKMSLSTTEGVEFVKVPNFKSLKAYYKKIEAKNIIKNEVKNADCVIARLPSAIGSMAVKYAVKYEKPYLVEVVGCTWDSLRNHSFKGKLIAPYSYLKTKKLIKDTPYAIYVTNEFLQRRYPCKGESINCSNVTLPTLDDNVIERRLNKIECMDNSKSIIFGTIGAVNVKYKGQQYVIKVISELNKEGYNIEYHLLGDGDNSYLMEVAEKYNVADKVKFLGSLPHELVFEYLDNIDIYIQPSKTEGLPRALIEAMSRGCPAIGSNVGGIPELLDEDCIFEKTDYKKLMKIIDENVFDQNWLKGKAIRNFEEAKKYYQDNIEFSRSKFLQEFRVYVEKKSSI